jgi:hypothetical protein
MADFKTTSYQADYLKHFDDAADQETNIYYNLPDQFTQYEYRSYNPIDFMTSSGEFNLDLVNKSYRQEQLMRMKHFRELEKRKLARESAIPSNLANSRNGQANTKTPLELTVGENIIQFQNTFFDIVTDVFDGTKPLNSQIMTENNRLFYLGFFFVMIFVIYSAINNMRK